MGIIIEIINNKIENLFRSIIEIFLNDVLNISKKKEKITYRYVFKLETSMNVPYRQIIKKYITSKK